MVTTRSAHEQALSRSDAETERTESPLDDLSPSPTRLRTTVACYSVFDKFFPSCGMLDYTEGLYHGNPDTPLDVAQTNQIDYVLDEAQCGPDTRLLDIGCGNGTLVERAQQRGAQAVGITISPEQVRLCRARGLDVRLHNYRDLTPDWGQFDAVIANGPMEHFVQPAEAAAGRDSAIYHEFFSIVHGLIDRESSNRRFVNTTIYFVRRPDPAKLLRPPSDFARGSDAFHYAMLARSFGGWYPVEGQLARAADGLFEQTHETDGTQDYHWTSEAWLRRIRDEFTSRRAVRLLCRSVPILFQHPIQLARMLRCMLGSESWNWQFRGPSPPTRLLRQTWTYVEPTVATGLAN